MKVLIVGGSFDNEGGRSSSVVTKFAKEIDKYLEKYWARTGEKNSLTINNGGYFKEIEYILQDTADADIVFWWANVPNDMPKIRNVKEVNPKCMLVTSKRNDNEKYNFSELINHALGAKANLCVEFSKGNDRKFNMMVFDPLGNNWYSGENIKECTKAMMDRLVFLKDVTRQGCKNVDGKVSVPNEEKFFDLIKENAEVFHKLINPAPGVTRFLGNSSFRCQRGFPSFKNDKMVYVSRRNVDKRYISRDAFVPTYLEEGNVFYQGENKPSVDTPIQLRLYDRLPNIRYMMHAHVYIEDAPFTSNMVPCGGLEEVEEVVSAIEESYGNLDGNFYAINLIGHGSIVMASDVDLMKNISYVSRTFPEKISETKKMYEMELEI